MDKINKIRWQLIALFCVVFTISSLITYIVLSNLYNLNMLSVNVNLHTSYVIFYVFVFFITSIISLIIFSDLWFEKFSVNNVNISLLKFLTHNPEHDIFTGLYTKDTFEVKVKEIIATNPNKIGAMICVDIDNLKFINDKYGHSVGDEFILKLSDILIYLHKYNSIISRIAGDEFVVYLHGFESEDDLYSALKELYKYSNKFTITTHDEIVNKIRFSTGLAWYPRHASNYGDLFKYSDFALYYAKHNEKGKLTEFNMTRYKENYHMLENSLAINQLIDNELVRFAYQPIVDLQTGEIYAYEALMRSKMENFKSPLEIINVATMQSKLPQLESLVIFSVYENIAQNETLLGERKVFINSLPNQVLDTEQSNELVRRYEKHLNKVVVEITEQENINEINLTRKIEFINDFKLDMAIDDFGSGFSNERRILELEPNIVKVDMGLIQGISTNKDKQTIVTNLIHFCHDKNIKVVAEGVETSDDLKYIINIGVDYVQGYYVAKPNFEFVEIQESIKKEIIKYSKQG